MGNRASISFKNGQEESVALFSHWGGKEFQFEAIDYAMRLVKEQNDKKGRISVPLSRYEPSTIMVDFIREYTHNNYGSGRVERDLYIGKDRQDGDNSDNGHIAIDMVKIQEKVGVLVNK
jgi:hypothetical protein